MVHSGPHVLDSGPHPKRCEVFEGEEGGGQFTSLPRQLCLLVMIRLTLSDTPVTLFTNFPCTLFPNISTRHRARKAHIKHYLRTATLCFLSAHYLHTSVPDTTLARFRFLYKNENCTCTLDLAWRDVASSVKQRERRRPARAAERIGEDRSRVKFYGDIVGETSTTKRDNAASSET